MLKNKCVKCGEKEVTYGVVCYDCKAREDRHFFYFMIGFFVSFILLVGGVRWIWAEVVYDDWRCMFSECRILKE